MRSHLVQIIPKSAFGTPLKGDTLFGQLCWAVRNSCGEGRLDDFLNGYTSGQPFAVFSDAFPSGYIPRPSLPLNMFEMAAVVDRKTIKKRKWLPLERFDSPIIEWLSYCKPTDEVAGAVPKEFHQPHNTLNRETGTTGTGEFAPYTMPQLWYGSRTSEKSAMDSSVRLDVYVVLDETRLGLEEIRTLFSIIGERGFGRDAGIGLGKFEIESFESFELPAQKDANAWLTLAPCAPQGLAWNESRCFYQPFTRFGRHGDAGALLGNPFKTPILMADTGALLSPTSFERRLFTGQGFGGDGTLSKAILKTVHQGYTPVVAIKLPENKEGV